MGQLALASLYKTRALAHELLAFSADPAHLLLFFCA